jgi:hypothetical protein
MLKPFKVQTMHFWAVNGDGNTLFSGMNEVIEVQHTPSHDFVPFCFVCLRR